MSQQDLWFLVVTLILVSTIVAFVVRWVLSRRGRGDGGGNWWEGPWNDRR